MTKLAFTSRLVSARATCRDCTFEEWGQRVKATTSEHVTATGHTVDINANTMTSVGPDQPPQEQGSQHGG